MTCPICVSIDNTALVAGLRAGAVVLFVVAAVLIAAASRFAWRLRRFEQKHER